MRDMKAIRISERSKSKLMHIEAPGCIINIHVGLTNAEGRAVTRVDVLVDGNRYAGDPQWWQDGISGKRPDGILVVRELKS